MQQAHGFEPEVSEGLCARDTTYALQLCEHIFADTVLIEIGLYGGDHVIYDCAVYSRLIEVDGNVSASPNDLRRTQIAVSSSPLSYLT